MLDIDNDIIAAASKVIKQTCLLHIHPNYVTFVALILSAALPFLHFAGLPWLVVAALLTRQLCDVFDGAIARECKKTSTLGGYLDTFADTVCILALLTISVSFFVTDKLNAFLIAIICLLTYLTVTISLFGTEVMHDHAQFKQYGSDALKNVYTFNVNNSMLVCVLWAILYMILVKVNIPSFRK